MLVASVLSVFSCSLVDSSVIGVWNEKIIIHELIVYSNLKDYVPSGHCTGQSRAVYKSTSFSCRTTYNLTLIVYNSLQSVLCTQHVSIIVWRS